MLKEIYRKDALKPILRAILLVLAPLQLLSVNLDIFSNTISLFYLPRMVSMFNFILAFFVIFLFVVFKKERFPKWVLLLIFLIFTISFVSLILTPNSVSNTEKTYRYFKFVSPLSFF